MRLGHEVAGRLPEAEVWLVVGRLSPASRVEVEAGRVWMDSAHRASAGDEGSVAAGLLPSPSLLCALQLRCSVLAWGFECCFGNQCCPLVAFLACALPQLVQRTQRSFAGVCRRRCAWEDKGEGVAAGIVIKPTSRVRGSQAGEVAPEQNTTSKSIDGGKHAYASYGMGPCCHATHADSSRHC